MFDCKPKQKPNEQVDQGATAPTPAPVSAAAALGLAAAPARHYFRGNQTYGHQGGARRQEKEQPSASVNDGSQI
jgi:hypothetical protein